MNRSQRGALIAGIVAALAFVLWGPSIPIGHDDARYLTGMLVHGDRSGCGLVKIIVMDRFSCVMPAEFCSRYPSALDHRVRLAGYKINCDERAQIRCGATGDFFDKNFVVDECFGSTELVKIFPEGS